MARKKKINGCSEWAVVAVCEQIEKGELTFEELKEINPPMAVAVEKFNGKLARERAATVPYRLGFWDANGSARVYVNGGRLANERGSKVWFEADDSEGREFDFAIRHSGGMIDVMNLQLGEKPWERVAREALEAVGLALNDCTFADIVHTARQ